MRKCVLILLDGLGDRAFDIFGGQTPLAAAQTPVLDALAEAGANGLYHADRPGVALPSELAHYAMFGYRPETFPGRGALEALGAGIDLKRGDVAMLAHFASVREHEGSLFLVKDVPEVSGQEAMTLFQAVDSFEKGGIRISLHRTHQGFGILRLRGQATPWFTDTGTMRDGRFVSEPLPLAEKALDPDSQSTARVLKAYLVWAYHRLARLELNADRTSRGALAVNFLVTQRPGRLGGVVPFTELNGLRGLMLADGIMYRGLASYIGLDFLKQEKEQDPEREIEVKLRRAEAALSDYDFVHIHTKAPDQAAHAKDPERKKRVIEALDRGLAQAIQPLLDNPEVLIGVTADHSTPSCGQLVHSGEPVPVVLAGQGVRRDEVRRFDEVSAACGSLGGLRGDELMLMILNHLDMSRLAGIRDTPELRNFWPGPYRPFTLDNE